jgi:hypothetical protein
VLVPNTSSDLNGGRLLFGWRFVGAVDAAVVVVVAILIVVAVVVIVVIVAAAVSISAVLL